MFFWVVCCLVAVHSVDLVAVFEHAGTKAFLQRCTLDGKCQCLCQCWYQITVAVCWEVNLGEGRLAGRLPGWPEQQMGSTQPLVVSGCSKTQTTEYRTWLFGVVSQHRDYDVSLLCEWPRAISVARAEQSTGRLCCVVVAAAIEHAAAGPIIVHEQLPCQLVGNSFTRLPCIYCQHCHSARCTYHRTCGQYCCAQILVASATAL